ncbi:MAG: LysR family transcriptional regulator [Hyphomonadaceae bacterium]|nr:LysR family transcriptional regulator [Hyphomonadaceae bacterium]
MPWQRRRMDFRQIRYFIAAARKESFRGAAEEMNVAQSALSRRIADLEAELGVLLFNRQNRRVVLSPAGHYYLRQIEPLVAGLESASSHVRRFGAGMHGELTIGYNTIADCHRVVPECLREFRNRCPRVELKLVENTSVEQERAIASGIMDFGFCHETGNEDNNIEAIEICEDKVYAAFPARDIDLCGMNKIVLADLRGKEFILPSPIENPEYFAWIVNHCGEGGLRLNVVQFANSRNLILNLIASGFGVSFILSPDSRLSHEGVSFARVVDFHNVRKLLMISDKRRNSSAHNIFRETAIDIINRNAKS